MIENESILTTMAENGNTGPAAVNKGDLDSYEWQYIDGAIQNDEAIANIKALAREMGLSVDQLKAFNEWDNKGLEKKAAKWMSDRDNAHTSTIGELKKEWGARFDSNINSAKQMVAIVGNTVPEAIDFLEDSGLGNNPVMIKIFSAMGAMISGDSIGGTSSTSAHNARERGILHFPSMDK